MVRLCDFCHTKYVQATGCVFQLYYLFAFVVTALVGVLLERTLIRQLYGRPLETLLATWGVSLVLIYSQCIDKHGFGNINCRDTWLLL